MLDKIFFVFLLTFYLHPSYVAAAQTNFLEYLRGIDSFQSDFVEHRYSEAGRLIVSVEGTCKVMRPGMFRWHYLDTNEEQLVISDGITLWVYEPDLEQVFVRQGHSAENSTILKIFGVDDGSDQQYAVEQLSSANWFRLRLGSDDSILSVDVEYIDTIIKSVRSIDPSGFSTVIEFVNPKTNPRLKASDFQFVPPSDIDIIYEQR